MRGGGCGLMIWEVTLEEGPTFWEGAFASGAESMPSRRLPPPSGEVPVSAANKKVLAGQSGLPPAAPPYQEGPSRPVQTKRSFVAEKGKTRASASAGGRGRGRRRLCGGV